MEFLTEGSGIVQLLTDIFQHQRFFWRVAGLFWFFFFPFSSLLRASLVGDGGGKLSANLNNADR